MTTTSPVLTLISRIRALPPRDPAQMANYHAWIKTELTYTSNALEGNTLTRAETARIIEESTKANFADYLKSLQSKK